MTGNLKIRQKGVSTVEIVRMTGNLKIRQKGVSTVEILPMTVNFKGWLHHLTRHTGGGREEEVEEGEERCRGGLRHLTRRTQPAKTKSGLANCVESKVS